MVLTFFVGFAVTLLLFLLCCFVVLFTKLIYLKIKNFFYIPPAPVVIKKPKKRKTFRSMEIDPQSVDRIFFKKSS